MSQEQQTTELLVSMIRQRATTGLKKYGVTLDRKDLNEEEWLQHLLEEVCDAGGYILAAMRAARETRCSVLAAIDLLESDEPGTALAILKGIYD